jgi:hypothetical protein
MAKGSAIFLKKIDSGMHRVTQNVGWKGGLLYRCQGKKRVLKCCSGLCPKKTLGTAFWRVPSQKYPRQRVFIFTG